MHLVYLILVYYNKQLMDIFDELIYQLIHQLKMYLLVIFKQLDHNLLYKCLIQYFLLNRIVYRHK